MRILGRLTRDIEIKWLEGEGEPTCLATFGIAENYYSPKEDNKEGTNFFNCKMFGKRAEVFSEHVKKGHLIYIEGKIETERWKNEEGEDRSKQVIIVKDFKFCEKKVNDE